MKTKIDEWFAVFVLRHVARSAYTLPAPDQPFWTPLLNEMDNAEVGEEEADAASLKYHVKPAQFLGDHGKRFMEIVHESRQAGRNQAREQAEQDERRKRQQGNEDGDVWRRWHEADEAVRTYYLESAEREFPYLAHIPGYIRVYAVKAYAEDCARLATA